MPAFRTIVSMPEYPFRISYPNQLLSLGSCFAEHIGRKLEERHFPSLLNPFGIQYNPVSIARGLERLLQDAPFRPHELLEHQGLWHSFWHHGVFSHPNLEQALAGMNNAYRRAQAFLLSANRLILTLGTAHVFVYRPTGDVVANCHKLPGSAFDRRRISPREAMAALEPVLQELRLRLPELEVILTISPVRHIRDGLVENQRSKSVLLLAAAELARQHGFIHYFPAYEIVVDELRDYRFYEADMIHPSALAVDYIWERFGQAFFEEETHRIVQRVEKIRAASQHRPFHPRSAEHQRFLGQQLSLIDALEREFPFLKLEQERRIFKSQLEL
ncbi:MAG: GSCFA domain-containing protein [Phaeodactylibacter sp.]|nr:GSCFA domain-containing protein [Phaeodactylibacter sp.]MCB9276921.1 GSCFA domain-containing protein [Lewinellaceae bacterium]